MWKLRHFMCIGEGLSKIWLPNSLCCNNYSFLSYSIFEIPRSNLGQVFRGEDLLRSSK